MLDKLSVGVAVAAAMALAAKLVLTAGVTDLQKEVAARQQTLAASQVLGQVNGRLIQMLATASVERNDPALRDLLARNGVQFTVNPPAAPGSQPMSAMPAPGQP
jgi:hypothetical protein